MLISLDWTRPRDPPLSLGHASILANANQHNIETIPGSWSVNNPDFNVQMVSDFIMKHASPTTDVAIGAFVWNENDVQSILRSLYAQNYPGRIIIGGPQISYLKSGLEKFYPQADIFIRGYAENAIVELMSSKSSYPVINGVHYAGTPDKGASAMVNLDALPSPYLSGLIKPQNYIRLETQRGCPFKCAFCQHRESDITMKRRQFHLSRILQEIEWITQNTIIQDISVLDPTFNSGPNYLEILDKFISGKFSGKLSLQCRIEMVKKEFLDKISALNTTARVTLEFGLQTIDREEQKIINRPNNINAVTRVLKEVCAREINHEISLIFGLPKQTVNSFKKSIDFCIQHKTPVIHAFPLMLLRGTPMYDRKAEFGLVESHEMASPEINRIQTGIPHVVASNSFTYKDWQEMAKIAEELETSYNKKSLVSSIKNGTHLYSASMNNQFEQERQTREQLLPIPILEKSGFSVINPNLQINSGLGFNEIENRRKSEFFYDYNKNNYTNKNIQARSSSFFRGNSGMYNVVSRKHTNATWGISTTNSMVRPLLHMYNHTTQIKRNFTQFVMVGGRESVIQGLQKLSRPRCSPDGTSSY